MTWAAIHLPTVEELAADLPLTLLEPVPYNWLRDKGVTEQAINNPVPVRMARGRKGKNGVFIHDPKGPVWFAVEELTDILYYEPRTHEIAWEFGQAFAFGQDELHNPYASALGPLQVYETLVDWLLAGRRGLIIVQWAWCFDYLRDVAKIETPSEDFRRKLDRAMQPLHMPKILVRKKNPPNTEGQS